MSEKNQQKRNKKQKTLDFVTNPKWGGFKQFLSVIGMLLACIGWFVFDVPSFLKANSDKTSVEDVSPDHNNHVEIENSNIPKETISLSSDVQHAREKSRDGISEPLQNIVESMKTMDANLQRFRQLDNYNGNKPSTNFEIFLQKYYGLDENSPLGDELIVSMLSEEVEWSLKVKNILPTEHGALILVGVNNPVCELAMCPKEFLDDTYIEFDDVSGAPTILKEGDFIHVKGVLVDYKDKVTEPELRRRMHIHWNRIIYNETAK